MDWLLQSKWTPPMGRADTVVRPHLQAKLRAAVIGRPVTLVSAPAGYGKSTLLASLHQVVPGAAVAWVTLDDSDNDPMRFLLLLAGALQRVAPALNVGLPAALSDANQLRQALGALMNAAAASLPDPTLLVLDDLHAIAQPDLHLALAFLLEHLPPSLHVVIGTRHDPPLPLARLAARGQLAELRRADLSFTAAETAQLLGEALGLAITADELAAVQTRTEGWAVGLCLLAGSLGSTATPEEHRTRMTELIQSDRYIFDFLADEVLRVQEPAVRRFLLQTAVLPELTPAACRAVTGDDSAAALLEEVYRRNLFLDQTGETYRYHALFAAFLQRQLALERPGEAAQLHLRAAAAEALPARRMPHYLAAQAWELAAQTLESLAPALLTQGLAATLLTWYGALPADVRDAHPVLALLVGGGEMVRGRYEAARPLLVQARRGFAAVGNGPGEGGAVATLVTLYAQAGDFARLRELIAEASGLPMLPLSRLQIHLGAAIDGTMRGDWSRATAELTDAFRLAEESSDPALPTILALGLSPLLAALPGVMPLVEAFCSRVTGGAGPETVSPLHMAAAEMMAAVHLWRGRVDEAVENARAAERLKERLGVYPAAGYVAQMTLAAAYALQGESEAAGACADRLMQQGDAAYAWLRPLGLFVAGRTYWLLGRPNEAIRAYERLEHLHPDEPQPFLEALVAALGALVGRRPAPAPAPGAGAPAVESLLQLFGPALEPDGPTVPAAFRDLLEPLTQREIEVLHLLAAGASNKEIGAKLYIGAETVKTHVTRILRKLDVATRAQAIARAHELGLSPGLSPK